MKLHWIAAVLAGLGLSLAAQGRTIDAQQVEGAPQRGIEVQLQAERDFVPAT